MTETEQEYAHRFRDFYKPFVKRTSLVKGVYGLLLMPYWKKWGLGVPVYVRNRQSWEELFGLIRLQNFVAGVLSHDPKKAKQYLGGELMYYDIVEEVEAWLESR